MEPEFFIIIRVKTPHGFETIGRFMLGRSRERAADAFKNLKGNEILNDNCLLHMELLEVKDGWPVNLVIISCTLEQLGHNCKMITRELFKFASLEHQ